MALYKTVSGKTYSDKDVEKVGNNYYVKGTSINVSPVSRSSGSSGSKVVSSLSRTPKPTTSKTTTSKPVFSSKLPSNRITGYDPNWFRNLPTEIQQKAQQERQRVGLSPAPTDRPLAYGEYGGGKVLPSLKTLPERVRQTISSTEQQAFTDWYNREYLPQQKQIIQKEEQKRQEMFNQLMPQLKEITMPDVDEIYRNVLRGKQAAVGAQKQEALERFEREALPKLRADLAASGFLHSDVRFARERAARESLEKTLQAIQTNAEADAFEETLKRAGLEADIAKTMADVTLRQQALALQAQANAAQQAYQQGLLGLQREQFEWGKPLTIAELTGVIPKGLPGAGRDTLASRKLESDIETQRLGGLLTATGLMGRVPQVGGQFAGLASSLGLEEGMPTAETTNAELNRALQRLLANRATSTTGTTAGVSDRYASIMNKALEDVADAKGDRALNEKIDGWTNRLRTEGAAGLVGTDEANVGIAALENLRPKPQAKTATTGGGSLIDILRGIGGAIGSSRTIPGAR